jgi:glucokinase
MARAPLEPRWIAGVDIGGTTTSVGLVPLEGGRPRGVRSGPTRGERGGEAVAVWIAEMLEEAIESVVGGAGGARDAVLGVGIGCPGPLDPATGRVIATPNLGWTDVPIRDLVAGAVGLPATLENDANCATWGEWWQGAGRGVGTLVGITIGTGVGGGLVIDGVLHRGASGVAGEVGHMTIRHDGRRCACGSHGCLEAYASGPSIAARAVEGVEAGVPSTLADLVGGDLRRVTAATVSEAARLGDPLAREIMEETARLLGAGLASLVNLLNPGAIVIAGGVTAAGEALFGPLRAEVRRRAFPSAAEACRIVPARYPEEAGMIGAAGLFRSAHGLDG